MIDEIGDRMKGYEVAFNYKHTARLPVILRFDGNSFSKFTKVTHLEKPFDPRMQRAMLAAAQAVLDYCSGSVLAYTQSDEISVLLRNDQTFHTEPFLAARVQKIASLCTATLAVAFDRAFRAEGFTQYPAPAFDCRLFILPPDEVVNYFIWRQIDAWKNCVSAFAYYKLGERMGRGTAQKLIHGMGQADRIQVCIERLGADPRELPAQWRNGVCIVQKEVQTPIRELMPPEKFEKLVVAKRVQPDKVVTRKIWEPDFAIPWFINDRDYIMRRLVREVEAA